MTLGEWLCTTAMHVGPRAVDLAVDEALEIDAPARRVDRAAVEVERQDVGRRRPAPGAMLRASRKCSADAVMPDADVTEAVDDALVVEDAIGDRELVDQRGRSGAGGVDSTSGPWRDVIARCARSSPACSSGARRSDSSRPCPDCL